MSQRRIEDSDSNELYRDHGVTATMATALRTDHTAGGPTKPGAAPAHEESSGISMFWRVFGGTILSIIALVGITLYNNLNASIAELRATIAKMNEERADIIRKDEFSTRMNSNWDRLQGLQSQNNEQYATLRTYRAEMDSLKENLTRTCTELVAVRKDLSPLEGIKEKVTMLSSEMKSLRDEASKLRQDVDKNQIADQERKLSRDAQHKEFEKSIKDVQAAMQDLQIKLARMEGAQENGAGKGKSTTPMQPETKTETAEPKK